MYWDWTNKYIVDESQFLTGEERSMESGLTGDEGYARVGPGDKETLATRRPVRIYYCKQLK